MALAFYLTAVELEDRNNKRLARQFAFWAYSLYTYLEDLEGKRDCKRIIGEDKDLEAGAFELGRDYANFLQIFPPTDINFEKSDDFARRIKEELIGMIEEGMI